MFILHLQPIAIPACKIWGAVRPSAAASDVKTITCYNGRAHRRDLPACARQPEIVERSAAKCWIFTRVVGGKLLVLLSLRLAFW